MDSLHHGGLDGRPSVEALAAEADALRAQQDLFELYVADYAHIARCRVGGARWWGPFLTLVPPPCLALAGWV